MNAPAGNPRSYSATRMRLGKLLLIIGGVLLFGSIVAILSCLAVTWRAQRGIASARIVQLQITENKEDGRIIKGALNVTDSTRIARIVGLLFSDKQHVRWYNPFASHHACLQAVTLTIKIPEGKQELTVTQEEAEGVAQVSIDHAVCWSISRRQAGGLRALVLDDQPAGQPQ